jgi:hypothetical protein
MVIELKLINKRIIETKSVMNLKKLYNLSLSDELKEECLIVSLGLHANSFREINKLF